MSNMDPQHGCPFFNRLPGEVRDEIFNLAVTEYCTKKWPLEKNQHYYRPSKSSFSSSFVAVKDFHLYLLRHHH